MSDSGRVAKDNRDGDTLIDLVARISARGERQAVGIRRSFGVRWCTYRRLAADAQGWASHLEAAGVARGDRVVLWADNSAEWAAAFLGAAVRGAIVVPIDSSSSRAFAERIAEQTGAAAVIHDGRADVEGLARVELSTLSRREPRRAASTVAVSPDDPAVIMFTSGTTGEPKGIVLTHRNIMSQVDAFRRYRLPARMGRPRLLCLSPLSHVQGVVVGLVIPLSLGVTVLFAESVAANHVIDVIKQQRVNLVLAVPRIQHLLARAIQDAPYLSTGRTIGDRVARVRFFPLRRHLLFRGLHSIVGYRFWTLLVGGAPLSRDDERFWFDCGLVLVQGYGLTETAAIVSLKINSPFRPPSGSVGRPLRGQDVHIGAGGEVRVRGRNVSPGAWEDDSAGLLDGDGFLATGDLAERAGRGGLRFVGRSDDVIVTAEGANVYPVDVEHALSRVHGVLDAVVVGRAPDAAAEVHAVLLTARSTPVAEMIETVNRELQPHQRVRSWTVWPADDFPRTALGKVRRDAVLAELDRLAVPPVDHGPGSTAAARADHDRTSRIDETSSLDGIRHIADRRERIRRLAAVIAGSTRVSDADDYRLAHDFDLSSLDIVEVLSMAEQSTAVPRSQRLTFDEQQSIGDINRTFASRSGTPRHAPRAGPVMDRPSLRLGHRLIAPWLLPLWSRAIARLEITGGERLVDVEAPFIIACGHHEHGADALVLYRALPRRLRRKLAVVTSDWLFQDYTDPTSDPARWRRLLVGFGFRVGMPVIFPFVLWPSHSLSARGLVETGRLIDRGFSFVVFPGDDADAGAGVARMAAETGAVVVPVALGGNETLTMLPRRRRRRIEVRIGEALTANDRVDSEMVTRRVADLVFDLSTDP